MRFGGIAFSCRRELHFRDPGGSQGPPMTTPRPGSRVIRSLGSFWGDRALVHARASVWGVQGVPGASLGHPCGSPGSHFRSTGRLQGLLGVPGSSRGALWGALGSPRGIILESSPLRRRLFFVTICYTFTPSATEGIFAAFACLTLRAGADGRAVAEDVELQAAAPHLRHQAQGLF